MMKRGISNPSGLVLRLRMGFGGQWLLGLVAVLLAGCWTWTSSAQLAITEVMSDASEAVLPKRPDFWELTNFGKTRVDLSSYRWSDSAGFEAADPLFFRGRSIGPGESIVLVRSNVVTTLFLQQFLDWWGGGELAQPLQVIFYRGPGFSQDYDAVQLWKVTGASTTLVDRVEVSAATPGFTHIYDPETGRFDSLSRAGVNGAFRAAAGLDVGSPGRTTGPVPLRVLEVPSSQEVDAGTPVAFSVAVQGLPKPQFQWQFDGKPIPGATQATLTIANAVESMAGAYTVEIDNGLEKWVSVPAWLHVSSVPSCARLTQGPRDLEVTPGQDATFSVVARGFPLPRFQWRFNGVQIVGATNRWVTLGGVSPGMSGEVSVEVTNPLCSTNASAHLWVTPPPDLRVTEVMAAASTNHTAHQHGDWWELTNFGTNRVSLAGYRFDDTPGVIEGSTVITNAMVIDSGESVIFVSDLSREEFVRWWGAENLPEGLQIVSYAGNSFEALGDSLFLWNATATSREDVIASLSFVNDTRGVSLWFDPVLAEFGELSVENEGGAFRAAESDDIGSPGHASGAPLRLVPSRLSLSLSADGGRQLAWNTQRGYVYTLEYCDDLLQPSWAILESIIAESNSLTTMDRYAGSSQRFYRVTASPPLLE